MRILLFAGASMLALASPAVAQDDHLDLGNTPVAARAGTYASSVTAGLNWYFNPYAKLMLDWVRFRGNNTPLDPVGSKTKGDAIATRLHLDF
jgi:phosphate-selective porin